MDKMYSLPLAQSLLTFLPHTYYTILSLRAYLPLQILRLNIWCSVIHCTFCIHSPTYLSFFLPLPLPLIFPLHPPCSSVPCPSSTLLSSAVAIRSRALPQMIRTVTSVLGSPLPPLAPAPPPLTPTHTRPRLTPPLLWGKGRYSCMIVTMKECFRRASGFYGINMIGSCWGWIFDAF